MDGTEDDQIKIGEIKDYTMPSVEKEITLLEDDEENGSESEFTEVDTDYSNDLSEFDSDTYTFNLILYPSQIFFYKKF